MSRISGIRPEIGGAMCICAMNSNGGSMKRVLSVLLGSLLIMLTLAFAGEPIASAQTTNTATVTRQRHYRHKRSFWQKHRDKLTVAGTGLAGAGIGGRTGGRKRAARGDAGGGGRGAV